MDTFHLQCFLRVLRFFLLKFDQPKLFEFIFVWPKNFFLNFFEIIFSQLEFTLYSPFVFKDRISSFFAHRSSFERQSSQCQKNQMIINIKIQNQTQTLTTLISNWSPPASLVIFCVLWLGDLVERLLKLNIIIIHSLILQIWCHFSYFDWSNFEKLKKFALKKVCTTCAWKEQKKIKNCVYVVAVSV